MILLLLLAADAVVGALTTGRFRGVIFAGIWTGLAFQAKMTEAWLILPALGLVYVIAAADRWRRRVLGAAVMVVVAAVVSLSWMTAVSLTPASTRPYVDGSHDDSLYQQVFVYNGFGRVDEASPNQLLTQSIGLRIPPPPPVGWNRLLTGSLGRDTGWLFPAASLSLVLGLVETRRRSRRDPIRVAFLLWGTWLLTFAIVFSFGSSINSYYTAALSPPIAGLIATGAVLAWETRHSVWTKLVVIAVGLTSVAYATWLLPATGTGMPTSLEPAVLVLGAVALGVIIISTRRVAPTRLFFAGLTATLVVALLVPAVAVGVDRVQSSRVVRHALPISRRH